MNKPARPKTKTIVLRLPVDLVEELQAQADDQNRPRANLAAADVKEAVALRKALKEAKHE